MLKEHLFLFIEIHGTTHFMQDGASCHRTEVISKFSEDQDVEVLSWAGNSLYLNPIENILGYMKRESQAQGVYSIKELVDGEQEHQVARVRRQLLQRSLSIHAKTSLRDDCKERRYTVISKLYVAS